MARRTAVLTVVITSLIAVLAMNTKLLQGQAAVPTIQTDKSDYHPGEFVTVTGSGTTVHKSRSAQENMTSPRTFERSNPERR